MNPSSKHNTYPTEFWILFLTVFAAMLGLGIIGPLMPIFASRLGATGIALGLVFSGFSLSRTITMPVVGYQSDKRGRKRFLIMGLILYSIISIGYLFTHNIVELIWLRLLHGMASAMVIPIAMAYAGELARKGREGEMMGTFSIATMTGLGVGPLLGGVLTDWFGESAAFVALTVLAAFAALLAFQFLPERNATHSKKQNGTFWENIQQVMKSRKILGVLWFRFVMTLARGTIISFFPLYAAATGQSLSSIGILLSTNMLLMSLFQKPFGSLSDRLGWRIPFILVGMVLAAVSLFLIPFAHSFQMLLLLNIVMGIGGALAFPAAVALVVEFGREIGMGSAMGYFNMALSTGMIFAPIFSGMVYDMWDINTIFYVNGSIILAGIGVFYMLVHPLRRSVP